MNSLLILACLFAAPWPQEHPPKTDPPSKTEQPPKADPPSKTEQPTKTDSSHKTDPPPKQNSAREAALEAIKNATPVTDEKTTSANTTGNRSEVAPRANVGGSSLGRVGTTSTGTAAHAGAGSGSASRSTAPPVAKSAAPITDADRKASILFVANALLQQELANRKQIISLAEIGTPEAALAELETGNHRFMDGGRVRTLLTAQEPTLRASLANGQNPFAVVVSCSDSRSMDNLIFDQELGRIFSIRAAGNNLDDLGIASIEYAVEKLGSKIVIIMGHTHCGAVKAVADAKKGEVLPGNMHIFQSLMAGVLDIVPKDLNEPNDDYHARLEQENAKYQARAVFDRSKIIRDHISQNKIWLVPALYDLNTGQVWFYKPIG